MTPGVHQTLGWAADGAAHLRGLMARLADEAFSAPSALPGWSRAHVLTHVARGADAMVNVLTWARTGVVTPAYATPEQRDAEIEAGARRPPAEIRADVERTSDRLAAAAREMPEAAWSATVHARGRDLPASELPWLRAMEMWIHAVDLDVGASLGDMPAPMLLDLVGVVVHDVGAGAGAPGLRLRSVDADRTWDLAGGGPEVAGTTVQLAEWAMGRARGKRLRYEPGGKPPVLPAWL